jgi:hypothetical protein
VPGEPPELDRTKLLAARYRAASDRPYLASALYSLTIVPSDGVPTMGVDRHWRCYVSPAFVDATGVPELAGVWIHEVAHLLRDHHGRAERLPAADQRDHLRVNVAQDCEINDDLLADGLVLPAGRAEPQAFGLPAGGCSRNTCPTSPRTTSTMTADGLTPWPAEPSACRIIAALIGEGAPPPPGWVETARVT